MISVCVATFNGSFYIREQLDSILNQLSQNDEVLIADDQSTDGTLTVIRQIADSRIKILDTHKRVGVVKNFERALFACKGEYIFISDQDDVWLPGKVDQCISALQEHLMVVTDCVVVDSQLNQIAPSFFLLRGSRAGLIRNFWKNSYVGCCMAFRRTLLNDALPFPAKVPMHDMWLGLIAEILGSVFFIAEQYSLYRRHDSNLSATSTKSNVGFIQRIKYRMLLAYSLFGWLLSNLIRKESSTR